MSYTAFSVQKDAVKKEIQSFNKVKNDDMNHHIFEGSSINKSMS